LSTADFIPSGRILPSMHETPLLVSPPIGHLYFGAVVVVGAGGAGVGVGVGVGGGGGGVGGGGGKVKHASEGKSTRVIASKKGYKKIISSVYL